MLCQTPSDNEGCCHSRSYDPVAIAPDSDTRNEIVRDCCVSTPSDSEGMLCQTPSDNEGCCHSSRVYGPVAIAPGSDTRNEIVRDCCVSTPSDSEGMLPLK